MEHEDLTPQITMVWDDNPKPTTTLIVVPSLIQFEHPAFRAAFGPPAEEFIKQLGYDGVVIAAVSFDKTGSMSDSRRFGAGLYAMLDKIHRGEFRYPCGNTSKPTSVFLDGTFDPMGGRMAIESLREFAATQDPARRPTITAAYLPSSDFGLFPTTTKIGSPSPSVELLSGELIAVDLPHDDTSQRQVMDLIGGHLAANPPVAGLPLSNRPPTGLASFRRPTNLAAGAERLRPTVFDPREHPPHGPLTPRRTPR